MNASVFNSQTWLWEMVWGAGLMVKFVLLVLIFFSVFTWAIIIYKIRLLKKAEKETAAFYDLFWEKRQFNLIHAACKNFKSTPLTNMFEAVHSEVMNTARAPDGSSVKLQKEDLERFQRILKKTSSIEASRLEYAVGFLATTGNTAPFIGLFGTVWGIMTSFRNIGASGSANLATVAPGISEALVATAMGLMAAIPAVVGYNHLLAKINRINTEMNNFSSDLLNILEKQAARK